VFDVVHRRWLEQVEEGLGGRRQSIMTNENMQTKTMRCKIKEEENKEGQLSRSRAIGVL
jgi:hypothetical protein